MAKVVQRLIRGYVSAACNIYSRLRLYKCFVESRICQRKFILKWLHQKGQTKKETNEPTNLGLLRYWTLWDWVGKEFEFVTTWPPMLVCPWLQLFLVFFSFTKIKRPLRALLALYQLLMFNFVVSNINIIAGQLYTVSLISKYHI